MSDINKIEKKLTELQKEVKSLSKGNTWEEREGREYRKEYVKNKYDVAKTNLPKGTKLILLEEFKKDGINSIAAGLNYLVEEYLKRRED